MLHVARERGKKELPFAGYSIGSFQLPVSSVAPMLVTESQETGE